MLKSERSFQLEEAQTKMSVTDGIVRYAIYPGIGIARVGNSPDKYFIGPEAPGQVPQADGSYKDRAGR